MNIEIKEDATYTFSFTKYENDTESNISAATISTKTADGTEILASTAMTISTTTATYALDTSASTVYSVARNFRAEFIIDGVTHIRLFDIVRYPFVNEVTIVELEKENKGALDLAGFKSDGEASTGSTTTAVDTSFIGEDTYLGGEIEIYPADNSEKTETFTITAFNDSTGEFTFSPARTNAVSTNMFRVRQSFSTEISRAGEIVQSDLWKREQRAYLILDNSQIINMIVYKFFQLMFAKRRTSLNEDDRDHVQYLYYENLYTGEYNGLPLVYDLNNDGSLTDDEFAIKDSIRLVR